MGPDPSTIPQYSAEKNERFPETDEVDTIPEGVIVVLTVELDVLIRFDKIKVFPPGVVDRKLPDPGEILDVPNALEVTKEPGVIVEFEAGDNILICIGDTLTLPASA